MSSFEDTSYSLHPYIPVAEQENEERSYQKKMHVLEQQHLREQRSRDLDTFSSESKDFLLTESLYDIMKKCFPESISESLLSTGRNMIANFVHENGTESLLSTFKTKSLYLSELANIVESTHKKVLHSCEGKDSPFKINNSQMKEFHNRLDRMTTDSITKEIAARVAKAEENFVKSNIKDKEAMEELAQKTKELIDNTRAKDADIENDIKQEHAAMYRRNLGNIMDRKKSILESIVLRTSEAVVKENAVREQFTQDNGKLDMQKIIEMSEVMYTVLEMVNTLNIRKVTPEYIQETLNSIA